VFEGSSKLLITNDKFELYKIRKVKNWKWSKFSCGWAPPFFLKHQAYSENTTTNNNHQVQTWLLYAMIKV
jgi:hypothetical protein